MTIKVYMSPTPSEAQGDDSNSINQIAIRLAKHLPKFGVEITENRNEAELTAFHAGQSSDTQCDVAMLHGLYPTYDASITSGWHWAANRAVINNVLGAKAVTVPSNWVKQIFERDMHFSPRVIPWAIDPDDWESAENQGYVLWAKNRTDGVCSPTPLIKLAALAHSTRFLSTFGEGTPNIRTTGRVPFPKMREMIRGAALYFSSTKETFGLTILEAMASGVPILGFKEGAITDIVEHGVTGYLVTPGDYDALLEGLDYCLKYRDVLGANARAVALTYTWDRVAEQFAAIYKAALQPHVGPKVSVVIPLHNYQSFVSDAVKSVAEQEINFTAELIIVDDGSTDNSYTAAFEALATYNNPSIETQLIKQVNGGVAAARNKGISLARGKYIVCLDADDMLGDPRFLQTLADSLDKDNRLGIVFTGLRFMAADGTPGNMAGWPSGYDYDEQTIGHNQVPTCCMFRKEAWARVGGYRRKYTPAEDAELWLRIGSLGYKAQQVTTDGWFLYRMHGESLSSTVRTGAKKEPDWRGDKPWIASGQRPFASDGKVRHSWPVRNYDKPKVSVIIPVGPYHRDVVREAIDSVESQTEQYWECIVVNDSGAPLDLAGVPFIREISTGGQRGASVARNMGVAAARSGFIAFLDADDVLEPTFLEKTIRAYAIHGKYAYTDWNSLTKDGLLERHDTPEFDPLDVFRRTSIHSINILIPKADLLKVGGFDEGMGTWEDVDLFMKLAAAGICGVRVAEPLITYRYQSGQLRERGEAIKSDLLTLLRTRYAEYMTGDKKPMCCGSGGPKGKQASSEATVEALAGGTGMVRIMYKGPQATHEVIGPVTKKRYGRREAGDVFFVYLEDHQMSPDVYMPIGSIDVAEPTPVPPEPTLINQKVIA